MAFRRSRVRRFTRRIFIQRLAFFGGGVVLIGAAPQRKGARASPAPVAKRAEGIFTEEQRAIVSAACERIVPRDEDPGSSDVGVPVYIERMLQTPELERLKKSFLAGTAALGRRAIRMFGKPFYELPPERQDELLALFKDSPPNSGEAGYFELLVILTMEGLLGDPSYGGNKDRAGWALIGFGTSEPPPNYDGTRHLHSHRSR